MKKIILYLFSFLMVITLFSCKKQEEQKTSTINLDVLEDTSDILTESNDSIEIDGIVYNDLVIPTLEVSMLLPESFYFSGGNEYYLKFTSDEDKYIGTEISITRLPNFTVDPEMLAGFSINAQTLINNVFEYDTQLGSKLDFSTEDFSSLESSLILGDKQVVIPLDWESPDSSYIFYYEFDTTEEISYPALTISRNNLIGEYYHGVETLSTPNGSTSGDFFVQYNFSLHADKEYIIHIVSPLFSRELASQIMSAVSENLVYTTNLAGKTSTVTLKDYELSTGGTVTLPAGWGMYRLQDVSVFTCEDLDSVFFGHKVALIKETEKENLAKIATALADGKVTEQEFFSSHYFQEFEGNISYSFDCPHSAFSYTTEVFPFYGKGSVYDSSGSKYYIVVFSQKYSASSAQKLYELLKESN